MRADVARRLVPLVEDNGWFFDTELLVLAERNGLRVHEVAVDWVDDPTSSVDIVKTAKDDLKGVARMMRDLARGKGDLTAAGGPGAVPAPRLEPSPAGQLRQPDLDGGALPLPGSVSRRRHRGRRTMKALLRKLSEQPDGRAGRGA